MKRCEGANIPYDVETSISGGQDGMFRPGGGVNFREAKKACLGREKEIPLGGGLGRSQRSAHPWGPKLRTAQVCG